LRGEEDREELMKGLRLRAEWSDGREAQTAESSEAMGREI
jgi:hypothetical protein